MWRSKSLTKKQKYEIEITDKRYITRRARSSCILSYLRKERIQLSKELKKVKTATYSPSLPGKSSPLGREKEYRKSFPLSPRETQFWSVRQRFGKTERKSRLNTFGR